MTSFNDNKKSPILALVKDPIEDWGLTTHQLINSYHNCLKDPKFNFLGYKSNLSDFVTEEPDQLTIENSKYFNLYSEYIYSNKSVHNFYPLLSNYSFTHDLILTSMPDNTLYTLRNRLSDLLTIHPDNIKLTFIEANITLLSHRDSDYFNKNTNIHHYMQRIKEAMITESALNWNLLGQESLFRIVDGPNKYRNKGLGELSFFNPCRYKHGTSYNTHRLTLSVRFFDIDYSAMWERISQKLKILEINPQ